MRRLAAATTAGLFASVALMGASTTAAKAVVPAPPTPWAAYHVADLGITGACQVTFTWGPEASGMVDHFEYAVTDYRPDPRSDSWRDQEIQTTATSAVQLVPRGSAVWVSVHAETYTNQPSGTSQAGTDSVTC